MAHLQAHLRALLPEEGGSRHPFCSGYRPLLHYDGEPENRLHVVEVRMAQEGFYPGEEGIVDILLHHPEFHTAPVGAGFDLRDGNRKRVVGRIISIVKS